MRPSRTAFRLAAMGCALVLGTPSSFAQDNKGGIYSCTDSQGRRITSDRPIPECLDREQRVLGATGVVKRVMPPNYTADERAKIEAQKKIEKAEETRIAEEKRRNRALLMRYPNQEVHDKERGEALAQIDDVVNAVKKRSKVLTDQRSEIDTELEFYQSDVKKAPAWLQRKLEDNMQQLEIQQRFLAEQAQEKKRIGARFDEELVKLRQLWANR